MLLNANSVKFLYEKLSIKSHIKTQSQSSGETLLDKVNTTQSDKERILVSQILIQFFSHAVSTYEIFPI